MPFAFKTTEMGLVIVEPRVFPDDRGFFMETYKKSEFEKHGINVDFKQENQSKSVRGTLRGLHYQAPPMAQGKLVRVIEGRVLDVAVDIRRGSEFFGQWYAIELSAENKLMFYVPEGFAHGFYTLSDTAQLVYKVTNEYSPRHERGIAWNDPDIGIKWPVDGPPLLSPKDREHPLLKDAEVFE